MVRCNHKKVKVICFKIERKDDSTEDAERSGSEGHQYWSLEAFQRW